MRRRLGIPHWTWNWAWRLLAAWSRLDIDPRRLDVRERWSVVGAVVLALARTRLLRPTEFWLVSRTPIWIIRRRLQRRTHGWYRVPSAAAADHVRLRFDMWPINVEDHVRIGGSRLTAVGYASRDFTEIVFILPNGTPEPDPKSPDMARARAMSAKRR